MRKRGAAESRRGPAAALVAVTLAVVLALVAGCGSSSSYTSSPAGSSASPAGATGGGAGAPASPTLLADEPLPTVTPQRPLKLLVTGDSLLEDAGPALFRLLAPTGRVTGQTVPEFSSGLVRTDFFDWPAQARRITAGGAAPDAVIFLVGGNDDQPIQLAGGRLLAPASPEWTAEYARRAGTVLDALLGGGVRRVYWLTMPTTLSPRLNQAVVAMGQAVHTAADHRAGVVVLDTDAALGAPPSTPGYRQSDGIHLGTQGAQRLAGVLRDRLVADWPGLH